MERGRPDGAGPLHNLLGPHEEHHDRIGDLVFAHRDDLVHVPLDQSDGDAGRPLHGDPVRQRRPPATPTSLPASWEARNGAHTAACTATTRTCGAQASIARDSGHQPATAEGHDHHGEIVHVPDDLEAERALAGHDRRVVEGVDEVQAGLLRPRLG